MSGETARTDAGSATAASAGSDWQVDDAADLYRMDAWSDDFYVVNGDGRVAVKPRRDAELTITIADVLAEVRRRDIGLPVLLRFMDVLRARVRRINTAFRAAIEECGYRNDYRGVYPIKVNQLHEVVEEVLDAGQAFGVGLECGSKAELIAALPYLKDDDTLLICNGVKDRTMLSLILSAQRLGKNVIPVMEKFAEFEQLMRLTGETGLETQFGVRIRLRTAGSGKWADSGGYRSKFGISLPELIEIVERLQRDRARRMRSCCCISTWAARISDIRILGQATTEIAQIYAELKHRGVPIRYLDVGGGLGVDYSADNGCRCHSLHAAGIRGRRGVVDRGRLQRARSGAPGTDLRKDGRALTAHHSVLVVETLGAYQKDRIATDYAAPEAAHDLVKRLAALHTDLLQASPGSLDPRELLATYHTVDAAHRDAATMFRLGYLPLEQDALVERLYWSLCALILKGLREADPDPLPQEFFELEEKLVDQYLCDFSVFQSMLDHWAIGQAFPIMPLERLTERPGRRALLVDLTCDSDGKVSEYVSSNDDKSFLELHALEPGKPYYLGIFLMGAYQDIMGDAHNLFGRVSEVHVYADGEEDGNFWIEKVIPGLRVQDMLAQVQYFPNDLRRRMEELVKAKIEAGDIRPKRGMQILTEYEACFGQETYYDTRTHSPVTPQ
ncbi:MAG: biosynthetic arginine decarboxylase [Woeseiaceae bacterium]|nr:biosynthetic arginine decarboxylase [Woeseiaceae bacterium]